MAQIKIHCDEIKLVPLAEIKPNPKNFNSHPSDQIKRLADIIEYQGVRYPIKVSTRSGMISSGHGRLEAAKLLGMTHFPVSYQDYDDEDQETADLISDNSIAAWSELDLSGINSELASFDPQFNLDLLGIKNFVLDLSAENPLAEKSATDAEDSKHILEVHLPTEKDMLEVYNDLLSRGFIVKSK